MMADKKRVYENEVTVVGELKELEVRDLKTKKGVPMKIANLQVKTGEGEVHRATMMAVEYFERDGKQEENKAYKAIETMESDYISIKNIADRKLEDNPTVVRVFGSLENNMYKNSNTGEVVENTQINARFVNRLDTPITEDFGVEFKIEVFVASNPTPILDKDYNETGSVKFKVATIDYRGEAHPFEVVADNEYGVAEWAEENLSLGETLTINGVWHNKYNIKRVERPNPAGVGKPIIDTKREIDNRILVEGITPVVDEDDIRIIPVEVIKEAQKAYEQHKTEVKSSETKSENTKGVKGVKGVQGTNTSTVKKKPTTTIDPADLPF